MEKRTLLIKSAYWLGIGADALWALGLLFPGLYSMMTGTSGFQADVMTRQTMLVAATLMSGWTILLIWAVKNPFERRFVILLTAVVVCCLFLVALNGFLTGKATLIWVLIKCPILFVFMILSYRLSSSIVTV